MFRAVTVSREFGSGGAAVAKLVAERLNWKLLDNALVNEIARRARVDPVLARKYDEAVDSWLHRVSRASLWQGAFEGVARLDQQEVFDAETTAHLAANLIQEAYAQGQCVIVGRAAQCILQNRPDAFHVFIYAPWEDRVARVQAREPEGNAEERIRSVDRMREEYVRRYYGCTWADPHLYHLLISSHAGEEAVTSVVISAMEAAAR